MMGGALGLAVLASVSDARHDHLVDAGREALEALTGGYHLAFGVGAAFAAAAAALGSALIRDPEPTAAARRPRRRRHLRYRSTGRPRWPPPLPSAIGRFG